jgi:hypothetical protein
MSPRLVLAALAGWFVGSAKNKWLFNKPCCGQLAIIPQAGSDIALRAARATASRIWSNMALTCTA